MLQPHHQYILFLKLWLKYPFLQQTFAEAPMLHQCSWWALHCTYSLPGLRSYRLQSSDLQRDQPWWCAPDHAHVGWEEDIRTSILEIKQNKREKNLSILFDLGIFPYSLCQTVTCQLLPNVFWMENGIPWCCGNASGPLQLGFIVVSMVRVSEVLDYIFWVKVKVTIVKWTTA